VPAVADPPVPPPVPPPMPPLPPVEPVVLPTVLPVAAEPAIGVAGAPDVPYAAFVPGLCAMPPPDAPPA
jgi:hypothetical protein